MKEPRSTNDRNLYSTNRVCSIYSLYFSIAKEKDEHSAGSVIQCFVQDVFSVEPTIPVPAMSSRVERSVLPYMPILLLRLLYCCVCQSARIVRLQCMEVQSSASADRRHGVPCSQHELLTQPLVAVLLLLLSALLCATPPS